MSKRQLLRCLLMSLVVGGFFAAGATAQDQDRPRRPGGAGGDDANRGDRGRGGRGDFDPEQLRQRMSQIMKERLGFSDEEWQLIEPRINAVQTAQRNLGGGGFSFGGPGGFSFRGGPGGGEGRGPGGAGGPDGRGPGGPGGFRGRGGPDGEDRPQSEISQKMRALGELLRDENSDPKRIETALTDLRNARKKAEADLQTARGELRPLLTSRQEAMLVTMSILD